MISAAQAPPSLILEKIAEYTLHVLDDAVSPSYHCICYPHLHALPLLGVCHSWRSAVLSDMYREIHWCSDLGCQNCERCKRNGNTSITDLLTVLRTGYLGYAKTVKIHIRIEDIVNGVILVLLRSEPFGGLVLPGVTSLEFRFASITESSKFKTLAETTRAQLFSDEIWRMFPNARSAVISDLGFNHWSIHEPFMKQLLSGLLTDKPSVHTINAFPALDEIISLNPAKLRSLSVGGVWPTAPKIELVHRHSETLEFLCVADDTPEAFHDIIIRDCGTPVVYPRLRSLCFDLDTRLYSRQQVVYSSPEGAPFPCLQHLVCVPEYPFANDVLLRGNEDTLEVIRLYVTPPVVKGLIQNGVARVGRFPALQFVEVTVLDIKSGEYTMGEFDTDVTDDDDDMQNYYYHGYGIDTVRIILGLGHGARVVKSTNSVMPSDSLHVMTSEFGRYIKVLDMRLSRMPLYLQLQLIGHLPCLTHFGAGHDMFADMSVSSAQHTRCKGPCSRKPGYHDKVRKMRGSYIPYFVDSHLDQICDTLADIPTIYTEKYPVSDSLVHIFGSLPDRCYMWDTLMSYVTMMLLCPSLKRVQERKKQTPPHRKSDYSDILWRFDRETVANIESFSKANKRLRQLHSISE